MQKLTWLFWRRGRKCEKFTDVRTVRRTLDKKGSEKLFLLRWANKRNVLPYQFSWNMLDSTKYLVPQLMTLILDTQLVWWPPLSYDTCFKLYFHKKATRRMILAFLYLHNKKINFVFKSVFLQVYCHGIISWADIVRCWGSAGCHDYHGRL